MYRQPWHAKLERNEALFDMRVFGCTYVSIGKHYGIHMSRARDVYLMLAMHRRYQAARLPVNLPRR